MWLRSVLQSRNLGSPACVGPLFTLSPLLVVLHQNQKRLLHRADIGQMRLALHAFFAHCILTRSEGVF